MPKVLLADDDFTMVSLLKTLLGLEGYDVDTLLDKPGDILEVIRRIGPDFLIVDIFLGNRNGIDLVRTMRAQSDLKNINVIMVSGIDKTQECFDAGADAFLLKPYMPEDLLRLLHGKQKDTPA